MTISPVRPPSAVERLERSARTAPPAANPDSLRFGRVLDQEVASGTTPTSSAERVPEGWVTVPVSTACTCAACRAAAGAPSIGSSTAGPARPLLSEARDLAVRSAQAAILGATFASTDNLWSVQATRETSSGQSPI
jgi:hypothetical protein